MVNIQELGKRMRSIANRSKFDDVQFAVTGKAYSNGQVKLRGRSSDNDEIPAHLAYVRINGDVERTQIAVNNVTDSVNVPVYVGLNKKGELEIQQTDITTAGESLTEKLANASIPTLNGALRGDLWYRHNIAIWRVRISDAGGLNVTVDVNFYENSSGWQIFPKTDIDLAASQPVSGKCWVVISFDIETGTLQQTAGAAVSIVAPLLYTDIANIAFTGYALAAIPITSSQSGFTTRKDWFDIQPFGASLGAGSSGSAAFPIEISTASGTPTFTVAENEQYVVTEYAIGDGGALTINGRVTVL